MDDAVRALARDAGIADEWVDAADRPQRVTIGSLRLILTALGLANATAGDLTESRARLSTNSAAPRGVVTATVGEPIALRDVGLEQDAAAELALESGAAEPVVLRMARHGALLPAISEAGYHRLSFAGRCITLAVAPPRCVTLAEIAPRRKLYGLAVQLYALRRDNDDGFGDAAALSELAASAAREGADAIALSPVHSLFAADPSHYGPYSPSNRLFLNPLYADPAMLFGAARVAAARAAVAASAPAPSSSAQDRLIAWPQAARAKFTLLRRLFDDFADHDQATPLRTDFESFVRQGGDRLREHAVFEALHEYCLGAHDPKWSWTEWPEQWRAAGNPDVAAFAHAQARTVHFHMFLQWITARSFSVVQRGARDAGMRVGLIADVAIGMNPAGSHAWSRQGDLLLGLSVGAPPDLFNPRGQDWGLTAFSPQALIANAFEPFTATLRAAMGHAGGVRIDHVMGLTRLWLIPRGSAPDQGAYMAYPVDDLLRITALESHRHGAIVIGEDLGTVPATFRARLSRAGIAGMDVLWFQRDKTEYLPPAAWRDDAVAMTTTHDLPTIAGWWQGGDITTRAALGLADEKREMRDRARDRKAIWRAFRKTGVAHGAAPKDAEPAVDAGLAFTACAPAPLALIPIEDVLGLAEQPNLPGTIDEHPNWRRRLPATAAEVLGSPQARRRLKLLRERGG